MRSGKRKRQENLPSFRLKEGEEKTHAGVLTAAPTSNKQRVLPNHRPAHAA